MNRYYVACVDLFGVNPPLEECDEIPAPSAAAAAEYIARCINSESDIFLESQVIAVAKITGSPQRWQHFLVTGTISYSTEPVDVATASKAR